MGVFDYIRCEFALPRNVAKELQFQTKNTDAQCLEQYVIDKDGWLCHEEFATKKLEKTRFTGEVVFYTADKHDNWIEFSAYFVKGRLKELEDLSTETGPSQ